MADNNPFDDEDILQEATKAPEVGGGALTLNETQKTFIDANWSKVDLMELVRHIYKNDGLDGRSTEGKLVREYLRQKGYSYKTSLKPKKEIELTEDNKEFAILYAKDMKPYEIARVIFKDEKITQFHKESLTVQEFIKSTNPSLLKKDDEYTDDVYLPPKTSKRLLEKINEVNSQTFEEDKLNVKMKKCLEKALEFMQSPRFVQTVNNLKNISERIIFESEYIRSVWDKPDLTADEINLYISLMNEYVIQDRLHRIMTKLNMILESVTEDKEGKISMALSDSIKGKSEELHRSLSRQQDFTTLLTGKRADRQKLQTARAKSLVALVEAFRDEAERKNAIRLAELKKKSVKDEAERLENFDEWEVRIFGITKEEIFE